MLRYQCGRNPAGPNACAAPGPSPLHYFGIDAALARQRTCIKHTYKLEVYVRRRTLMVSRWQKFNIGVLGLLPVLLTFGCGGGGSGTELRVLDASPDETNVQVVVDGAALGSA